MGRAICSRTATHPSGSVYVFGDGAVLDVQWSSRAPVGCAWYAGIIETKWSGRALGEVIDRYRIEVLPFKRSEQTRRDEGRALDRLKAVFGHMLPDKVMPQVCCKCMDTGRSKDGKLVPVAARHEMALLGHVFSRAIRWDVASVNPVRGLDFGERPGKRAQVTTDQVDAVRALASERIRVAIDLAVSTRQRRGDLLTLRREHPD